MTFEDKRSYWFPAVLATVIVSSGRVLQSFLNKVPVDYKFLNKLFNHSNLSVA